MIVVCECGQKSRVKDLSLVNKLRCASCQLPLGPEVHRQAARNADIVLQLTASLEAKEHWTFSESMVAFVIAHHEGGLQ